MKAHEARIEFETAAVTRRSVLKTVGATLTMPPLAGLVGCGGGEAGSVGAVEPDEPGGGGDGGGDGAVGGGDATGGGVNRTTWLAGGTAAMTAEFPPESDPLDLSLGNVMCTITGTDAYTIGPCFFDVDDFREDISEGEPGVPMTLVLKLVDADCAPVEGAYIEVWWCDREGIYSGDSSESTGAVSGFRADFCTGNDADGLAARWFRGIQRTDSVGNVYFLGCFPGWYRGRTTHIHFRVVVDGVQRLVSQFCFDDDISNDLYLNHPDYTGEPKDTDNGSDSVFRRDWQDYMIIVDQQWDGSMLAYKGIQIV